MATHHHGLSAFACSIAVGVFAGDAQAKPTAPREFCSMYSGAPECLGRTITCTKCHTSTQPVAWNNYGLAVFAELGGRPFDDNLAHALASIEDIDSDGDGLVNLEEIELGTNPGDPLSQWMPLPEPGGPGNDHYDVGVYDPRFAFRRVRLLFCGSSPSFDEVAAFTELDHDDQRASLHETLGTCLESTYWIDEALVELAHPKIRPVTAYGADTTISVMGFVITVADYEWDYRLWQYVLTGDRDAREMLTAQYHVGRDDAGELVVVEGVIPPPAMRFAGGQPIEPEHRAGMLTTQWNLFLNTMFSAVPRVTAGQAYRAFLGLDLSLQQGIDPVHGEPLDLDAKGVDAPACAQCHSTLDPMAYAFAEYEGFDMTNAPSLVIGTYRPDRPAARIPGWEEAKPDFIVLGQTVGSLVEMARVMADSPEFSRNLAHMMFVYAVGHEPQPEELAEFDAIWTALPDDGYSANRLLHRLIDTDAFGTP
ncbi:MAG TPA: DUF1585 domain-containing protein [Nannocystaceae bacterium]|nr:DUF1585 domain-containing protein [Nannocystaceae bacterium]